MNVDKIIYTVIKPHNEEEMNICSHILEDMDISYKYGECSIIVDFIDYDDLVDVLSGCDSKGYVNTLAHIVYYSENRLYSEAITNNGFATEWDMV